MRIYVWVMLGCVQLALAGCKRTQSAQLLQQNLPGLPTTIKDIFAYDWDGERYKEPCETHLNIFEQKLFFREDHINHLCPAMLAAYMQGNMLFPQVGTGLALVMATTILAAESDYRDSVFDLVYIDFSDEQVEIFGEIVNRIHQEVRVNATYDRSWQDPEETETAEEEVLEPAKVFGPRRLRDQYKTALRYGLIFVSYVLNQDPDNPSPQSIWEFLTGLATEAELDAVAENEDLTLASVIPLARYVDAISNSPVGGFVSLRMEEAERQKLLQRRKELQHSVGAVARFYRERLRMLKAYKLTAKWRQAQLTNSAYSYHKSVNPTSMSEGRQQALRNLFGWLKEEFSQENELEKTKEVNFFFDLIYQTLAPPEEKE